MSKQAILKEFELFSVGREGIGAWLNDGTNPEVFSRLGTIAAEPLSKVQLNQLLVFGREAPVSDDFFRYYWLEKPPDHPYSVEGLPGFDEAWVTDSNIHIRSLAHLKWGFYRLYVDGLLYVGDVCTAFRKFRGMAAAELTRFFARRRFDTKRIKERGPALPLKLISKDDRYLISEMACKSFGDSPETPGRFDRQSRPRTRSICV